MKNIENKTIRISVRVSEEELKIIEKRASLTNEKSLSSYLRKQAIKGFIINVNFSEFKSSMIYEIGVANGSIPVFYTRQFINSIPYIFQFQKIFPYTNGIPMLLFSFFGFLVILKSYLKHKFDSNL